MENLSNFQHIKDLVVPKRMVKINGNHAQLLFALKVLILFKIDGQNIKKLELQNLPISSPIILKSKQVGNLCNEANNIRIDFDNKVICSLLLFLPLPIDMIDCMWQQLHFLLLHQPIAYLQHNLSDVCLELLLIVVLYQLAHDHRYFLDEL